MWVSCQAIIWISVLAGLFRVFANQVTYHNDVMYNMMLMNCRKMEGETKIKLTAMLLVK